MTTNNEAKLIEIERGTEEILIKDELAAQELVPVLHHIEQEPLDISLLYPNRRYLSPKVKVAIEFFTQLMQEQKPYL